MIERTPIQTGFGSESTIWDVVEGIDLAGTRAVVTGASSGIGIETARALVTVGAEMTLAVRDPAAGKRTAAEIRAATNGVVRVGLLDLADLASINAFIAAWDGPLHLLVNNAGVMRIPSLELVGRGWERLSSGGHLRLPVAFDDLSFSKRPYDAAIAYGQSKTANVLFAVDAHRRCSSEGITVNAVHRERSSTPTCPGT